MRFGTSFRPPTHHILQMTCFSLARVSALWTSGPKRISLHVPEGPSTSRLAGGFLRDSAIPTLHIVFQTLFLIIITNIHNYYEACGCVHGVSGSNDVETPSYTKSSGLISRGKNHLQDRRPRVCSAFSMYHCQMFRQSLYGTAKGF